MGKFTKAMFKPTRITVYIHEGVEPIGRHNAGMKVISKQIASPYTFCAKPENLIEF